MTSITAGSYQLADGTYVVTDSEAVPCILAYFKSKITVYYPVMDDGKTFEVRPIIITLSNSLFNFYF